MVRRFGMGEVGAAGLERPRRVTGRGCDSLEVLPPVGRYGVAVAIDSVVVAELPLAFVRDQLQNADVRVGHDHAPPGSGNVIAVAVA